MKSSDAEGLLRKLSEDIRQPQDPEQLLLNFAASFVSEVVIWEQSSNV